MGAPTHKPGCETVFFRPARCLNCNQIVYFWGCSCGSRVLFDATDKPWPKHRCANATMSTAPSISGKAQSRSKPDGSPNVKFISTYTYGVSSVVCMRCGKTVRKRELPAHNYWTHGIGERPSDPVKRSSGTKRSRRTPVSSGPQAKGERPSKRPMITCKVCKQSVRQSRLEKHMRKAHPGSLSTNTPQGAPKVSSARRRLPNGAAPTNHMIDPEDLGTRDAESGSAFREVEELSPRVLCEAVSRCVYEAGRIQREVLLRDVARSLRLDLVPEVRSRLGNAVAALVLIGTVYADGEQVWRSDLNQGSASSTTRGEPPRY